MTFPRKSILDPIDMPGWRWNAFLNHAINALSTFEIYPYSIPQEFIDRKAQIGSKLNSTEVQISTWGCRFPKVNKVRAACVNAGNIASVLNLVIHPSNYYDLPFFGVDLVTLPSGHLLALDLQPILKDDEIHTKNVWNKLFDIYQRYKSNLPTGGPIPKEAEDYFSPYLIWTRFPISEESDYLINSIIKSAFNEYLDVYIALIKQAGLQSKNRADLLLDGQNRYLRYRAKKDPARSMLTRFYGNTWTNTYINEILFSI